MHREKSTRIFMTPLNEINNKNLKAHYGQSLQGDTIPNLKSILFVCRLFGMAPYTISNKKISLSDIGIIYSGIIVLYFVYVVFVRAQIYYDDNMDQKLKILSIARLILLASTVCVDIILCIYWDRKMQNSLNHALYYEKMIRLKRKKNNIFLIITWILTIMNVAFFLFMGLLSYLFNKAEGKGAIVYVTLYLAMIFGIFKFLLIAIVICKRFRDLNQYLKQELSASRRLYSKNVNELFNLHDVWLLHDELSLSLKDLNSLYSIQLFLWISTIAFNIISRIYLFFTTTLDRHFYWDLREMLLSVYFITLLASVTIICHATAKEANKTSSIIFSSKYCQRDQDNNKRDRFLIGHYFLNYSFNFTAGFGFFVVDSQLLLSIAGSITTYLVILIGPTSLSN